MRVKLISMIFTIFLLSLTPSILAYKITEEKPNSTGGLYSVIGVARDCSIYPDETFEVDSEENVVITDIFMQVCGDANAFANLFDSEWVPYMEYKDGSFKCIFEGGCLLEIYCCPYGECNEDNFCKKNEGIFSRCKTIQCGEWKNDGYKCDVKKLEEKIPYQYSEISYCTKSSNSLIYIPIAILVIIIIGVIYALKKKPSKKK